MFQQIYMRTLVSDNLLIARTLLNYLTEKKIHATFFVVGSRVIERPQVLTEQYMSGHEISVHTWSHRVNLRLLPA